MNDTEKLIAEVFRRSKETYYFPEPPTDHKDAVKLAQMLKKVMAALKQALPFLECDW